MRHTDKSHTTTVMEDTKSLFYCCFSTDTLESCICSSPEDFTDFVNAFFATLSYNRSRT